MQRPDKIVLDVSHKIARFIKKLTLWKEDIASLSESSRNFIFLSNFEKKTMLLPSKLQKTFSRHQSKLELKFSDYFFEIDS